MFTVRHRDSVFAVSHGESTAATGNVGHREVGGFMSDEALLAAHQKFDESVRVCIEMEEYDSKQIPSVSGQLESLR